MLRHLTRTQTPSRQRFSRRHALTIVATADCADRFCTLYRVRQNNVDSMFVWASPSLGPFVKSRNKWDNFLGIRESCENCCGEYIQM